MYREGLLVRRVYSDEPILAYPISKIGDWAIDHLGTIAHSCGGSGGISFGRTTRIFSPITGRKERTCIRCSATCTDEIEMLSKLRRIGAKRGE